MSDLAWFGLCYVCYMIGMAVGASGARRMHYRAITGTPRYRLDQGRIICQVLQDAPESPTEGQ